MSSRRRRYTFRVLLPSALALILALETVALVAAVGQPRGETAATALEAPRAATAQVVRAALPSDPREPGETGNPNVAPGEFVPVAPPKHVLSEPAGRPQAIQKTPKAKSVPTSSGTASTSDGAKTYKGRNRMWMPALGINRAVSFFSCTSKAYPGDRVYRWGCAGRNNVYLFGHAHSVFKPLHDAYVRGRLKKGMKVMYADGKGKVRTYKIAWWKVTTPTKGAFAYAAQSRPSLTLQTCVGANNKYRLIVRLVLAS